MEMENIEFNNVITVNLHCRNTVQKLCCIQKAQIQLQNPKQKLTL